MSNSRAYAAAVSRCKVNGSLRLKLLECSRVRNQSRDAEAWRPIEERRRRLPNWADATPKGAGKAQASGASRKTRRAACAHTHSCGATHSCVGDRKYNTISCHFLRFALGFFFTVSAAGTVCSGNENNLTRESSSWILCIVCETLAMIRDF